MTLPISTLTAAAPQHVAIQKLNDEATVIQRIEEMRNVHRATALTVHHQIDHLTTNLRNSISQLNGALSTVQHQQPKIAQLAAEHQRLSEKVAKLEKFKTTGLFRPKW